MNHDLKTDGENKKYPDSHGAVNIVNNSTATECVCITFPATGWYKIAGTDKSIYFRAGDQLVLNGPYTPPFPQTGDVK